MRRTLPCHDVTTAAAMAQPVRERVAAVMAAAAPVVAVPSIIPVDRMAP